MLSAGGVDHDRPTTKDGELYSKIVWTFAIISCFGGLVVGYDIGTSAELMVPFLEELDVFSLTAFTSSLYVAALLSYSLLVRKTAKIPPVLLGWIIIIAGILTCTLAKNLWMLVTGRILFGIGVGFIVDSAQFYEARCGFLRDPKKNTLPMTIAYGILMAHGVNYTLYSDGFWSNWRLSLGTMCILAVCAVIFHLLIGLPEIIEEEEESRDIETTEWADIEMSAHPNDVLLQMQKEKYQLWANDMKPRYPSYYLVAALAVPLLMYKLTGVNLVLMFYAPVLFQVIVTGCNASLLFSVVVFGVAAELVFRCIFR